MNYFIYTSHHFTLRGRYELNKLTSLPMCGFIAQMVGHRTGIGEVTGSYPVEVLIFFRLLLSNCLNLKIYCDDHSLHHTFIYNRSSNMNYFINYILHIRLNFVFYFRSTKHFSFVVNFQVFLKEILGFR